MLSSTTSSEPARVLIVDDNQAMLDRVSTVLKPACQIVGATKDGVSALEAARLLRPDVIVLDISMPGMTGFEVAAKLRKSGCLAALVFLTVHDDEAFVRAGRAAGVIGYVVKQRLASDLLRAIQEARAGRPFVSNR